MQISNALLVTKPENVRYLAGTGCEGLVVWKNPPVSPFFKGGEKVPPLWQRGVRGDLYFFTDARYFERARKEVKKGVKVVLMQRPNDQLQETVQKMKIKKLGFEAEDVSVARLERMKKRFRGVKLIPTTGVIEKMRQVKSAEEIKSITKACAITVKVLQATLKHVKRGVTELELAEHVRSYAAKFGAEGLAFDTIVAFGANAAVPHAVPGKRKLKKGELVLFDLGVKVGGYCADMSRTFFTAKPTDLQKAAYEAVLNAQLAGVDAIRSGVRCAEVDEIVRKQLQISPNPSLLKRGSEQSERGDFSSYFTHSTGHGVGIEIHEAPSLSPQSKDVLATGNIVTVEPGVYLPGKLGIRIEDTVLVLKNKAKILTKMPKQLIILSI